MSFCITCSTNLKKGWKICPICGQNLKLAVITPHTIKQTNQSIIITRKNGNGIISLIITTLGVVIFLLLLAKTFIFSDLPFVLLFLFLPPNIFYYLRAIIIFLIAINLGKRGMEIDKNPSIAKIGHNLSIVGLCCCLILIPTLIILSSLSGENIML